jgi:hypothetical protein
MDALPNRSSRRRRRKRSNKQQEAVAIEPVLIAARRPGSPRIEKPTRRMKAASAKPRPVRTVAPEAPTSGVQASEEPVRRREARIVQAKVAEVIDDREKERRKLLAHVMNAEGRSAISRAAENYFSAGFELPAEQEVQLKLLEHFDESRARAAIEVLSRLLESERPRQLPVFDQRLRRLEEHADEALTRDAAAVLRRALRA